MKLYFEPITARAGEAVTAVLYADDLPRGLAGADVQIHFTPFALSFSSAVGQSGTQVNGYGYPGGRAVLSVFGGLPAMPGPVALAKVYFTAGSASNTYLAIVADDGEGESATGAYDETFGNYDIELSTTTVTINV